MNRILVVSADLADLQRLQSVLGQARDEPFAIDVAGTLADALERLKVGDIDAILLDLLLPDSDGLAGFEQIAAAAAHTPILILCANQDDVLATAAIQRGATGYLLTGSYEHFLVPQALHNIIARKKVEEALFKEKTRAEIALNSIGDGVICTDVHGNIDYMNVAAEALTGWPREDAHGRPIEDVFKLINGSTGEDVPNPVNLVLQSGEPMGLDADTTLLRRDRSAAGIEDSAAPIRDWNGRLTGVVIVFHDVSAAQAMREKMAHLAHHDFLTNLPNRVLLNDRIAQAVVQARRHRTLFAVMFLDLDNFKHINDSLGHETGDLLLQSVTQRLQACIRDNDTLSRQGGDEFIILLSDCENMQAITTIAEKIQLALMAPHSIGNCELFVSASIGISLFPTDGISAEVLIKNADTAMYHAKETGRNTHRFFNAEMHIRAVERQSIESSLRRAMRNHEFVLHYQPKINLDSGRIAGAEALLRWVHPEMGLVQPGRFVTIAEECGLIVPIGQWVLREACAQILQWIKAGLTPASLAVNISALEFRQRGFVDSIDELLDEFGLPAEALQLEITEGVLMRDARASAKILHQLKDRGLQLAIDDFGTGYSSLSYLKQFPIDVLKIDQSFVHDIGSVADDGVIVSAVIGMGKNLNLKVVAEGVENVAQLSFLKDHHCEEGQGFLFSRPVGAEQFAMLLESDSDSPTNYGNENENNHNATDIDLL